ncbi:dimethylaniline monooxygenase [N-oxide-forming] 2-like [Branchiostoma floridae x Branchiostoma japonicum]
MDRKRVVIIGAGVSGLAAIKACLEEGLEPTCFEQSEEIGGLWHYTDDGRQKQGASMYKSLISNVSREMSCFSDFPFDKHTSPYPSHTQFHQYLQQYCNKFDLRKYIRFNTQVIKVQRAEGFVEGEWVVHTTDAGTDGTEPRQHVFHAVMVCVGHYQQPHMPSFAGLENYQGTVTHSQSYRTPDRFQGKTVVVIGAGNSAGDIAAEVGLAASKVYLSMRDGVWIVPRLTRGAKPLDLSISRALLNAPDFISRIYVKMLSRTHINQENYGIKDPSKDSFMVNDEIRFRLASGKVLAKPDIAEFTRTGVKFVDGSNVDADEVIFATGYDVSFPFLDSDILPSSLQDQELYKHVFPVHVKKHTLAVIGHTRTRSGLSQVAELHARWAAQVFKGITQLPDYHTMLERVRQDRQYRDSRFGPNKLPVVDLRYTDDIARDIGVRPSFWRLFLRDPSLAFLTYFGPAFPVHYRLQGRHSWSGAAEYAKTALLNTYSATRAGRVQTRSSSQLKVNGLIMVLLVCLMVAVLAVIVMIKI